MPNRAGPSRGGACRLHLAELVGLLHGVVRPFPPLILVPTDFSSASVEALGYALRLGEAMEAEVRLLHVLPDVEPGRQEDETSETADALKALRQLAASASAPPPCLVRRGRAPAEEIVAEARAVGAGVIVLGTCGQRRAHIGLGSVSGEVIQTAPCDVLLVPHRAENPFSSAPVRRILLPIDFSGASQPLASLGRRFADGLGAELDLVHVLEPLPHPVRWLDEAVVDLVPQIQERAASALRALADKADLKPERVHLYIERGKAAPSIPRVAEALGSDLILLGPHAERPVFDRLLGSVAEGVARRATCPVYIARVSAAPEGSGVDTHSYEVAV